MQSSRKSFKAYSVAQPLKKQIDDTLIKVELQKRKFLTYQRQQTFLKDTLQKKRKELNDLKAKEPQTKLYNTRVWQTANIINHVDKTHLNTYDSIQHLKNTINIHRRQIIKYKSMNIKLFSDIDKLTIDNNNTNSQNLALQHNNQFLKKQILTFRELHLSNVNQFQKSHTHINKQDFQDQNQRRIFSIKQKSFLGEEMRNSKIIPFDNLSDQLRNSGIRISDNSNEIMTESIPLAKQRIKIEIIKNRQKLKIAQNYKKFGESIENMFQVMKQYKGRDDLNFIAQQYVTKEKQLQKIQEYVSQLESRIQQGQNQLKLKKLQDESLDNEINTKIIKQDQKYIKLQEKTAQQIEVLKEKEGQFVKWFSKISEILLPLIPEPLTRSNASDLIGNIEMQLGLKKQQVDRKLPGKSTGLPSIEIQQKQSYNELMSYEKMREFAADFVRSKKYA